MFGFIVSWFLIRNDDEVHAADNCPLKTTMVQLAETKSHDDKLRKELQQYSLVQIQNGNYGYIDVLTTLKKKNNDKA